MRGSVPSFFLFLFDRLKEHWLIGLSDATFNEQRGRTFGGKLAWSSFCRTELMKPLWIWLKCAVYLCSCIERIHHTGNNYFNICLNQRCKSSILSPCNATKLPLIILSSNNETLALSLHLQHWTLILKKKVKAQSIYCIPMCLQLHLESFHTDFHISWVILLWMKK